MSHSFYIGRFTDKRPEQRRKHRIGKYGRMRRAYLKEHRKILYTNYVVDYVVEGTLFESLVIIIVQGTAMTIMKINDYSKIPLFCDKTAGFVDEK